MTGRRRRPAAPAQHDASTSPPRLHFHRSTKLPSGIEWRNLAARRAGAGADCNTTAGGGITLVDVFDWYNSGDYRGVLRCVLCPNFVQSSELRLGSAAPFSVRPWTIWWAVVGGRRRGGPLPLLLALSDWGMVVSGLGFPVWGRAPGLQAVVCSPAPQLVAPAAAAALVSAHASSAALRILLLLALGGYHWMAWWRSFTLRFGHRPDAAWHWDLPCFAFHHVDFCFIRADSCWLC
jgi:hypothetical protein